MSSSASQRVKGRPGPCPQVVYVKLCKMPVMVEAVLVQDAVCRRSFFYFLKKSMFRYSWSFEPRVVGLGTQRSD